MGHFYKGNIAFTCALMCSCKAVIAFLEFLLEAAPHLFCQTDSTGDYPYDKLPHNLNFGYGAADNYTTDQILLLLPRMDALRKKMRIAATKYY